MVTGGALLAAGLAGCTSNLGQHLPESMGGLPAGAPAQSATSYTYPAVHDMPPDRPVKPLSDAEQTRIENELRSAKERQEQEASDAAAAAAATSNPEAVPPAVPDKAASKQQKPPKNARRNAGNTGAAEQP
jgi:hypothetical protein